MSEVTASLGPLTQYATIASGLVLVGLLVWLAGLLAALRDSKPSERADIIRAYATCRPPVLIAYRGRSRTVIDEKENG
jgi:hypothetical protein